MITVSKEHTVTFSASLSEKDLIDCGYDLTGLSEEQIRKALNNAVDFCVSYFDCEIDGDIYGDAIIVEMQELGLKSANMGYQH